MVFKKIVLVVGHREKLEFGDKRIQGSTSAEGLTEYIFNCELASKIKFYLLENHADKVTVEIVRRDGKRLIEMPKTVLALSPDVGVELHCNSSEGHVGHGREVLILDNPLARKKCGDLAEILNHRIGLALYNRDRGMVYRKHGTNGAVILTLGTDFPFVLLEPFFIDHPTDCANALKRREELAVQIAEGFIDFLFQAKK